MFAQLLFRLVLVIVCFLFLLGARLDGAWQKAEASDLIDEQVFLSLLVPDAANAEKTLGLISDNWKEGYAPPLVEMIYLTRNIEIRPKMFSLLQQKTGSEAIFDLNEIYQKLWSKDYKLPEWYPAFKGRLYSVIDERFTEYFKDTSKSLIRLDEIRWGGVVQNGIPPLRKPEMISVKEASYLEDSNVVFGIGVNGDFRAYPKRILAWHEMFIDEVGGKSLTGAYCTLCGSMILYDNQAGGKLHKLGTSGFLYRSNKLMFDEDTNSFWNTLQGVPVVGPLVGKDIELKRLPVVTTTWGKWKKLHPKTTVLSLKTGHSRDYSEGAAYRDYFATDELMFTVPKLDKRLKNKAEVLALHSNSAEEPPVAVSSDFLKKNTVYPLSMAGKNYLILTDKSGAHRVYQADKVKFSKWDQSGSITDSSNQKWKVEEDALVSDSDNKNRLSRVAAHNAFWFGWYAAFPNTKLIH